MSYTHKIVNGVEVPLTPEEIAELEARDAAEAAPALDRALAAITEKYEAKRAALQADILRALTMDGANMDANLATLRAKWPTLADEENAEIMALFE